MEKVGLFIIIVASGLHFVAARQYHYISDNRNWKDAQKYCREKYTDLAIVNSLEDVTDINNLINNLNILNKPTTWIGLYDDRSSWRWSLSDSSFYNSGEADFTNWYTGQPNEYGHFNYCSRMDRNGMWNDLNCEMAFKVICSDVEGQNVSFVYVHTDMKWTEAQSYCRVHHTDLASARNKLENDRISKLIPGEESAWIGLFRSPWQWVDGRQPSLKYWSKNEPSVATQTCTVAHFENEMFGRWADWDCSRKTAFVCFSDSKHVVKLKLVTSSSLVLNNPIVQEDILNKLKQRLIDQEGKENFKLSWRKQVSGNVFDKEKNKNGF